MASASSKKRTACFLARQPEYRRDVFRRLSHPHRFELGVSDDQQAPSERVRDRFGADGLAGARRSREVERERQSGRVALAQPPSIEDEIVTGDLGERLVQRASRRRRQDDVLKRPPRDNGLDRAGSGPQGLQGGELRGNGANIAIMTPESLLSIGVGLALAAAAGFRVFVPLLALSLAAQQWMDRAVAVVCLARDDAATLALATATILEIAAYYVPFFDNALDTHRCPGRRARGRRGERVAS